MFSVDSAAEYLHVKSVDIEQLVKRGEIPFERMGDRVVFRKRELDAWASQRIMGFSERDLTDYHKVTSAKVHNLSRDAAIVTELMQPQFIDPQIVSRTKPALLRAMSDLAAKTDLLIHPEDLLAGLRDREALYSTALEGGVAMLHPRHHDPYTFEDSFVVLGRTIQALPFGAPDGRTTDIFFLICCQDDKIHLHVLARLCMMCHNTDLLVKLRESDDPAELYDAIRRAEESVIKGL
ncbi:MAG: PTS sugar transporter subunit IIA [Verrucomicrobia bacterium]|nr:PTS sugar transporter subunit IIA [Verrucomicrobiota bacterium]